MQKIDYRKEARGRECMIRMPKICNYNPETVVLAHMSGGGMGTKHPDQIGAWACSSCHDMVDRRTKMPAGLTVSRLEIYFLEGMVRTQLQLIKEGKL